CGNTTVATQYIDIIDNTLDCEFEHFPEEPDCNSANNQIGVLVSGGTPPYSYNWAMVDCDGFITSDPTQQNVFYTIGYTTQNFVVTITDANGCQRVCTNSVECEKEDEEEEEGEIEVLIGGFSPLVDVKIYPNPVDGQLTVAAPKWEEGTISVRIFGLLGQQMYEQRVNHGLAEGLRIDTQSYPEGTYVIRIDMEGYDPVFEQIMIQHR
ncbi:MAG: T9SS type A sorting domain-containing protein, partial [Bacteroidota bacterium]